MSRPRQIHRARRGGSRSSLVNARSRRSARIAYMSSRLHGVALHWRLAYGRAVEGPEQRAAQTRTASRVVARESPSSVGSRLQAAGEQIGSGAEIASIESS